MRCFNSAHEIYTRTTHTTQAIRILYRQGGIPRFYHGFIPALIQAPVARFGDTAANAGKDTRMCVRHSGVRMAYSSVFLSASLIDVCDIHPHTYSHTVAGVLALCSQYEGTKDVPIVFKTALGSVASAIWRVALMP
jgi:hypothetical protein